MLGCKLVTPIEPELKLCMNENNTSMDRERFERLVGYLIYLFQTRPNISFVVEVLS